MLEPVPTSDAARSAVPGAAGARVEDRRRSGDAYVDQLRTLLHKATDRVRVAEQATEAVQRELAAVRARLAEELAASAVLTEMAGEAERRAMKAEATAEALRTHLAGERPVPPVGEQLAGDVRVTSTPSARQTLEGMVRELHSIPLPASPVDAAAPKADVAPPAEVRDGASSPIELPDVAVAAGMASEGASATEPVPAAEPVPGGTVTVLPTASRRRWGR